jgi:hypothetical protein
MSPFLPYYMTRLSLPELCHLQTLCTHAFGYLSDLGDLELRAPESQEVENFIQVIFQYFPTLNSLADLQESIHLHLVESDLATHLLGLLNDYEQANPLDSAQDAKPDYPDNVLPTVDVKAVKCLAAAQLVEFCYADPEIYLNTAGYYRFVPKLSRIYWSPVFKSTPSEFFDLVNATFHQHPRRF